MPLRDRYWLPLMPTRVAGSDSLRTIMSSGVIFSTEVKTALLKHIRVSRLPMCSVLQRPCHWAFCDDGERKAPRYRFLRAKVKYASA